MVGGPPVSTPASCRCESQYHGRSGSPSRINAWRDTRFFGHLGSALVSDPLASSFPRYRNQAMERCDRPGVVSVPGTPPCFADTRSRPPGPHEPAPTRTSVAKTPHRERIPRPYSRCATVKSLSHVSLTAGCSNDMTYPHTAHRSRIVCGSFSLHCRRRMSLPESPPDTDSRWTQSPHNCLQLSYRREFFLVSNFLDNHLQTFFSPKTNRNRAR